MALRHVTLMWGVVSASDMITRLPPPRLGSRQTRLSSSWIFRPRPQTMAEQRRQQFDHFLVLDFEATCLPSGPLSPAEIIEFPVLKVNGHSMNVEAQFHAYVKPIHHPVLSVFCTELTGITQDMVEDQATFPEVLDQFQAWMRAEKILAGRSQFVLCGDWDLKTMLPNQCQLSGLDVPDCFAQWINIKKSYQAAMGTFPRHLNAMLHGLGMTFEGRAHSGIDDCENIARILKKLAQKPFTFTTTTTKDRHYVTRTQ